MDLCFGGVRMVAAVPLASHAAPHLGELERDFQWVDRLTHGSNFTLYREVGLATEMIATRARRPTVRADPERIWSAAVEMPFPAASREAGEPGLP